jgi:hypothetical protein
MSWMRYRDAEVQSTEDFKHEKLVTGTCRSCERKFEVLFTKQGPDTLFEPYCFECPCSAYAYYPDDNSESVNDEPVRSVQPALVA